MTVILLLAWGLPAIKAQPSAPPPPSPPSPYDAGIFQKLLSKDQLAFLGHLDGTPSGDLLRDKQFRKVLHSAVPDCVFHYGRDMSLNDALDKVFEGSRIPVQIAEGRYFIAAGSSGPYLGGRAFLWIDMQQGIALGAFFFHPTNGEPTPTVAVFSKQVETRDNSIKLSQLPPEFVRTLTQWSADSHVPAITTRYLLTGNKRRILLEHDEDYCAAENAPMVPQDVDCRQMIADSADIDETAAYYLNQVNYATNATAWMIGGDQTAWLQVRTSACAGVLDPLGCRIRMTREHIRVIVRR